MAPEMWNTIQNEEYTSAIDVWALGAITFCMLEGSSPFPDPTILGEYRNNQAPFPKLKLGPSGGPCESFIRCAMAAKPEDRLTAEEALDYHWLSRSKNIVCRWVSMHISD